MISNGVAPTWSNGSEIGWNGGAPFIYAQISNYTSYPFWFLNFNSNTHIHQQKKQGFRYFQNLVGVSSLAKSKVNIASNSFSPLLLTYSIIIKDEFLKPSISIFSAPTGTGLRTVLL